MKISINRKQFLDALTIGASMAGKAKTVPILECVKCRVSGNDITFVSTDVECWVLKRSTVVSHDEDFEFCVNPSDLTKALKSLNDEEVKLSVTDSIVSIIHTKGAIEFPSYDFKAFPTATKGDTPTTVTVSSELLFNWLNKAKNFVANDDLRPVMNGVYIYIKDGKIGVCATDAHKLFTDFTDFECDATLDIHAILSSRTFAPLMNMINGTDSVSMTIDAKNITFASNDAKISCRIIEGNYPNFNVIIPTSSKIKVQASKKDLIGAISRVSLFTNSTTSLVKLTSKDYVILVNGQDINFNKKAKDECPITLEGDEIEIGVKGDYMLNCLNVVAHEKVTLEMNDFQKPIVIKDIDNKNCVLLLMPMLIN